MFLFALFLKIVLDCEYFRLDLVVSPKYLSLLRRFDRQALNVDVASVTWCSCVLSGKQDEGEQHLKNARSV